MIEKRDENNTFDDVELTNDDQEFGEAELEDIELSSTEKVKKIKAKLKESEKEKQTHLENLQRAKAEFLNAKRRIEEEQLNNQKRAISKVIEKLLPVFDSFHMAMSNKVAWEEADATWRKGVENIHNQLQSILSSYNIEEFNPQGDIFNPKLHEAMANVPVTSAEEHNRIITVVQNGFIKKSDNEQELIRPARVTVGTFTE